MTAPAWTRVRWACVEADGAHPRLEAHAIVAVARCSHVTWSDSSFNTDSSGVSSTKVSARVWLGLDCLSALMCGWGLGVLPLSPRAMVSPLGYLVGSAPFFTLSCGVLTACASGYQA